MKKHIQLYSLKNEAEADFLGTLRRLKALGFDGVEFYGGFDWGFEAPQLRNVLAEIGLELVSCHVPSDDVARNVEFAKELGVQYLIDPMAAMKDCNEALEFCKKLEMAGEICKKHGIIFGYHNHAHEFAIGKDGYLLETLLRNTDPELVCFQLDVGWAAFAGVDSADLIKKYPGRFKILHFKECGHAFGPGTGQGVFQANPEMRDKWNVKAGSGLVDWKGVFSAAFADGIDCFIVEREHDYLGDIFKCAQEDLEALCGFLDGKREGAI